MYRLLLVALAGCTFSASTSGAPVTDDATGATPPPADAPGPDACADGDGDGVCNTADACPQGDDNADEDGDGVADACDDWPCGAKPNAPSSIVMWNGTNENVTLSLITVEGQGQRAVVAPGASIDIAATYSIVDCQCPGCIDQIEIGFHMVGKAACLYNGNPQGNGNCMQPTIGAATRTITAPTTKGLYQLRFNRGNDNACQANGAWWANIPPGAGNTFALVCVR